MSYCLHECTPCQVVNHPDCVCLFMLKTVETVSCFDATGVGRTVDATSSFETSLVGPKPR